MTPEAAELYRKLTIVASKLDKAKRFLEEVREVGAAAQENVTALRTEEHSLKDQLAALATKEGETK